MQTFKQFRPTQFDRAGLGSDGQEDWLVAPVSRQPKIATVLDDSNWEVVLADLGGALHHSLMDALSYLNDSNFETSFIVEIDVNDSDLINGLNAAMVGNFHTTFWGSVVDMYEAYRDDRGVWQVKV